MMLMLVLVLMMMTSSTSSVSHGWFSQQYFSILAIGAGC
jgi:hypothetical protein